MEFWFVRHGETEDNINHILQGHQPGKLSELGISQAKLTGIRLAKETFSEIYCSDLGRCKETLEYIMAPFQNKESVKVTYSSLIRERGFGVFENKATSVYKEAVQKSGIPFKDHKPKDGESYRELQQRAEQFVEIIKKKVIETKDNSLENENKLKNKEGKTSERENEEESKLTDAQIVPQNQGKTSPEKKEKAVKNTKILVVSHSGFLSELYEAIQNRQQDKSQNVGFGRLSNCGISVVKAVVEEKTGDVQLEFIQRNDSSHLTL